MTSSYNDNVNNDILIDLEDDDEVSNKKSKNTPCSTIQKRARPPKIPKDHNVSKSTSSAKARKNRSPFWDHFVRNPTNYERANCIHCDDEINCATVNGTSPLSNHIKRCSQFPANVDLKQKLLNFESRTVVNLDGSTENVSVPSLWNFDKERCRKVLAKMIIVNELPFRFVEKEGFIDYSKELNPRFLLPSRFTVARDCYGLFIKERRKLYDFFGKLSSRVCLTTDSWTSGQNLGYMCLTAHFIDADFILHKRVINFCLIPGHTGKLIGKTVEKCLSEWNLKNILTNTVDNASSNDVAIDYLRRKFNNSECDVMGGKYLHMRCAAHILNLVVRDGLNDLVKSIVRIRTLVKYVRSSPARKKRFDACVLEEKIESKSGVCLDVETRWNSTYLMLESALKYKKAFGCLLVKDSILQKEMSKIGDVTNEDWKEVSYFLPFLKIFYDATIKMSASRYVTSNSYVEVIFGVGEVISQHIEHPDEGIRKMAFQMKLKYDKYWGKIENLNLLLFVSLILDPRFKLVYVEWMVKTAYGVEKGGLLGLNIRYFFQTFFEFYASSTPNSMGGPSSSGTSTSTTSSKLPSKEKKQDDMFNFGALLSKKFEMEMGGGEEMKSELEKYLEDARESRETSFNILQWWKDNKKRYPVLSIMARDVLAIPVSSVASESAFSTGGRILDSFRTSLSPKMVEALICGQDWLRTSRTPLFVEECLLEMEKIEEGMEAFVLEQPEIIIDEIDG